MTIQNIRRHLESIHPDGSARTLQLKAYEDVAEKLGSPGAPQNAAAEMVALLSRNTTHAGK
jgi:lipid-A-disaccharide synthase